MSTQSTSIVGAYVYERGGITSDKSEDSAPVDHFDYCPN